MSSGWPPGQLTWPSVSMKGAEDTGRGQRHVPCQAHTWHRGAAWYLSREGQTYRPTIRGETRQTSHEWCKVTHRWRCAGGCVSRLELPSQNATSWAAYSHRHSLEHSPGGWKSKVKVSAGLVPLEILRRVCSEPGSWLLVLAASLACLGVRTSLPPPSPAHLFCPIPITTPLRRTPIGLD